MLNDLLTWLKSRQWRMLLAPLLILLICLILASTTLSPAYRDCADQQQNKSSKAEKAHFLHQLGVIVYCEGTFTEANNGAITAVATIFMAVFTLTLWLVTGRAVRLARDEFNATQRPQIIIHSAGAVFGLPGNPNTPIGITVRYYNKGIAPAKITNINCRIFTSPFLLGPNFHIDQRPDLLPSKSIASGEFEIFSFVSPTTADNLKLGNPIFCIGRIDYTDPGGRRRETGFIREFDASRHWISVPDDPNGYEYAY